MTVGSFGNFGDEIVLVFLMRFDFRQLKNGFFCSLSLVFVSRLNRLEQICRRFRWFCEEEAIIFYICFIDLQVLLFSFSPINLSFESPGVNLQVFGWFCERNFLRLFHRSGDCYWFCLVKLCVGGVFGTTFILDYENLRVNERL